MHATTINARPEPVEIEPAKTALIVVDMQNDFGSTGGMFDRAGIDISAIRAAVEPTRQAIAAARHAGIKIVYLKMGYRPDLSDLGAPTRRTERSIYAFRSANRRRRPTAASTGCSFATRGGPRSSTS